ncbi:GNAT family N-acetyltransferase [Celerinatantimonas yamalensis]|uniref:GNAT family N-acetyltransferase n=1 Tax=Celerinatantimonas yamalensis TaxID=559956 RepID=A0ABW9G2X5_9GAMM
MRSVLEKMSVQEFSTYFERLIIEYAKENIASGRWPEKGAIQHSRSDLWGLLPNGIYTVNNYLFNITNPENDTCVGALWLAIDEDIHTAFIFDVLIKNEFRRQGFATRALDAVQRYAKSLGMNHIGLHVFNHNTAAKQLYTLLGFREVSCNMNKELL